MYGEDVVPFVHKRQRGAAPDEQILYLVKRSMFKGKILVLQAFQ